MHLTFTLPGGERYHAGPLTEAATVGSSAEGCTIPLPCGSLAGQHAVIEPTGDPAGWQIRDLGPSHGLSDGETTSPAFLLAHGSTVYLGEVRLDVSAAPPGAEPSGAAAPHDEVAAQLARLRNVRPRRSQSGLVFGFFLLATAAFAAGFLVRYLR